MKQIAAMLGICLVSLGVLVSTATKAPAEPAREQVYGSTTIMLRDHPEVVREYETLEDASILTDIPEEVIMKSILSGQKTAEGYEFSYK